MNQYTLAADSMRVRDSGSILVTGVVGEDASMRPEINISKIPVGGGAAGLMIALVVIAIALIGIPATRMFLLASAVLGILIALVLRWTAHGRN